MQLTCIPQLATGAASSLVGRWMEWLREEHKLCRCYKDHSCQEPGRRRDRGDGTCPATTERAFYQQLGSSPHPCNYRECSLEWPKGVSAEWHLPPQLQRVVSRASLAKGRTAGASADIVKYRKWSWELPGSGRVTETTAARSATKAPREQWTTTIPLADPIPSSHPAPGEVACYTAAPIVCFWYTWATTTPENYRIRDQLLHLQICYQVDDKHRKLGNLKQQRNSLQTKGQDQNT